jgi:hypothetical protein
VWPIHRNFLFLISKFISSWSVTLHKSLLEIMLDHHILKIYLRHRLTKICILRRISLVTSHVSHLYKSTDFTQALKKTVGIKVGNVVTQIENKWLPIAKSNIRDFYHILK